LLASRAENMPAHVSPPRQAAGGTRSAEQQGRIGRCFASPLAAPISSSSRGHKLLECTHTGAACVQRPASMWQWRPLPSAPHHPLSSRLPVSRAGFMSPQLLFPASLLCPGSLLHNFPVLAAVPPPSPLPCLARASCPSQRRAPNSLALEAQPSRPLCSLPTRHTAMPGCLKRAPCTSLAARLRAQWPHLHAPSSTLSAHPAPFSLRGHRASHPAHPPVCSRKAGIPPLGAPRAPPNACPPSNHAMTLRRLFPHSRFFSRRCTPAGAALQLSHCCNHSELQVPRKPLWPGTAAARSWHSAPAAAQRAGQEESTAPCA
jgi:hypothetical protein